MNKLVKRFLWLIFIFLSFGITLHAEDNTNLCMERETVFGFFNGVQTRWEDAYIAKRYLKATFGNRTEADEKIKYELFCNYTNGFEDFVETFEQ